MYCNKCGNENREEANFCRACGNPTRQFQGSGNTGPTYYYPPYQANPYNYYPQFVEHKDPVVALLVAFMLPGVGHMYAGEVMKGIIILAFFVIVGIVLSVALFATFWSMSGPSGLAMLLIIIAFVISGLIWFYQLYDAYHAALRYDECHGLSRY